MSEPEEVLEPDDQVDVYAELEETIGYAFTDRALLIEAVTHPSHRHESDEDFDNQALEYLGDSALNFAVASSQITDTLRTPEGICTPIRSHLTGNRMLARIGKRLKMGGYLRLGAGEARSGGQHKKKNLADTVEALLGAVHLDGGFEAVQLVFQRVFAPELEEIAAGSFSSVQGNLKGSLQELLQKAGLPPPNYVTHKPMGPDHSRQFKVSVYLQEARFGVGFGTRKQVAEQQAAAAAYHYIVEHGLAHALENPPDDKDFPELPSF